MRLLVSLLAIELFSFCMDRFFALSYCSLFFMIKCYASSCFYLRYHKMQVICDCFYISYFILFSCDVLLHSKLYLAGVGC